MGKKKKPQKDSKDEKPRINLTRSGKPTKLRKKTRIQKFGYQVY